MHWCFRRDLQIRRNRFWRGYDLLLDNARGQRLALTFHILKKAKGAVNEALVELGTSNKCPFALNSVQLPLVDKIADGTSHGNPADAKLPAQFRFRRDRRSYPPGSIADPLQNGLFQVVILWNRCAVASIHMSR